MGSSTEGFDAETSKADALAGFLVFLIALPLCIGIALASGFPPFAGIVTAVVGGLVTGWLSGAPATIKGPAAGLIVIALGAVEELGQGDAVKGYHLALATIVVAGVLQVVFAALRAGRLGDLFPASAVHGMLAAIGILIASKQAHVMLGVKPKVTAPWELLLAIPSSVRDANLPIAAIGLTSLVILIAWPFVPFSWAKKIPSQLVVLLVAVPFGAALDLSHPHAVRVGLTGQYELGPKFLVAVPDHLLDVVSFPDFSHVFSSSSLSFVMMFALVGSVESLLSTKAIDATDPLGRKSNLDRDLFAVGLGNVLAGLLGGLPMIAEIVRSSANVASGARTRLANVFHGAYLLLFMALVPGWIHRIPLSALAAMLLFTGLKLASPKEFAHTYRLGHDQLAVFLTTIVATLATDLLVGIGLGICLKLVLHMVRGVPLRELWKPRMRQETIDGVHRLFLEGAVVFTNFLGLKDSLSKIALDTPVVVDLTRAHLVDHTVLSQLDALGAERRRSGGKLEVVGLDSHRASSMHPLATRYAQKVGREMGMGGER